MEIGEGGDRGGSGKYRGRVEGGDRGMELSRAEIGELLT